MPLEICVIRNGERVKGGGNYWIIALMTLASALDSGKGPWEENTFEGILGMRDRPKDDEWHNEEHCVGIEQDENDIFKCAGCGGVFPIVVSTGFQNVCSYLHLGATPLNNGPYTMKSYYMFIDQKDGEIFELFPGDILSAQRVSK